MINTPKILIIDDSATVAFFAAEILQKAGYQAIVIGDGREGLIRIWQNPPDCLLLDVVLPGMGGFEVCRRLRGDARSHQLPIVMISTKNTSVDQSWALRQGANRYLTKPFTGELLLETVNEVLPEAKRLAQTSPAKLMPTAQEQGQSAQILWQKLVPRRNEDVLWSNNPRSVIVSSRQARHLYTAIDGRKDLEMLCVATHMNMEELLSIIRILLAQRHIQLYEPDGRIVDNARIFSRR